jgi:hypothetical protein
LHTWRRNAQGRGQAKLAAYLDDYTCLAGGLVSLYEATFDPGHIDSAMSLMGAVLEHFIDAPQGGFFFTADDQEQLLCRNKDFTDHSLPSGNAMAAMTLIRLGKLTGNQRYLEVAEQTMRQAANLMHRVPGATGQMLMAVDFHLGPTYEMVLAGDLTDSATATVMADLRRRFLPNKVVAMPTASKTTHSDKTTLPDQTTSPDQKGALADLLVGKTAIGGSPTLYICEGFACQQPLQGKDEINHALDDLMP